MHIGHRHAFAQRLRRDQQTVGRGAGQGRRQLIFRCAFQLVNIVETDKAGFQTAQRLLQGFVDVPANRHHFADRFHRGVQQRLSTLELFKSKTRDFGDDIVNRWFKRCRGCAGDVIGNFVQRIAHRQFRRDFGNREACGFRCQR